MEEPSLPGDEDDRHLEDLARHMAAGPDLVGEPDGPSAWGGSVAQDQDALGEAGREADPPVSEYFRALLSWEIPDRRAPGDEVAGGGVEAGEATGQGHTRDDDPR